MNIELTSSKNQFKKYIKENGVFNKAIKTITFREHNKNQKSIFKILFRGVQEFKNVRNKFFIAIGIRILAIGFGALFPWMGYFMLNKILPYKHLTLLITACCILTVGAFFEIFFTRICMYLFCTINGYFSLLIRKRLMDRLEKLPLLKIQNLKVGGIISRLEEDAEYMSRMFGSNIGSPVETVCMYFIALISFFIVNPVLALFLFGLSIIIFCFTYLMFNVMRPYQKQLREETAEISADLNETFNNFQISKCFCKEKTMEKKYLIKNNLLWRKTFYSNLVGAFMDKGVDLIRIIMKVSILAIGGYYILTGKMQIGGIILFISFTDWVFEPINMIMNDLPHMQKCLACTERTFEFLDEEFEDENPNGLKLINNFSDGIHFHDVSVIYPNGTKALESTSLKIPKGKVTAIVGPSGGGKTTLTNLILRFFKPTSGKITIDNRDINEIDLNSYRKLLSLVLQDVVLFDGTIKDNIAFGYPKADFTRIQNAAKIAHCDVFIEEFENGYDTVVGEKGVKLSGGQKQRIALARAILTDPQLLILDEATSNLDSESEAYIQDSLSEIFKDRTSIVIAHRLSTISRADNIIVIDEGKIIEQGTHNNLLEISGKYSEMFNKQIETNKQTENYWVEK